MRAQKRLLSVVLSLAVALSTFMIPQTVKAATTDFYIEDTMLDFSSNGSYTLKFGSNEIDKFVPVYLGKKGIISIRY